MEQKQQLHLTPHKRFVPYGTRPNFCFAKTSFMLETLYEIAMEMKKNELE
jgi:hypothetical protein